MIRHKWIIGVRNNIMSYKAECDSCAAIEGAKLSRTERSELQSLLDKVVMYIDNHLT